MRDVQLARANGVAMGVSGKGGKKARSFKKEVIEEAVRIHGNVCRLRKEGAAELAGRFKISLDAGYWPGFQFSVGGYCNECLLEGLGWFAIHNDVDAARSAFTAARLALPYYKRMQELSLAAASNLGAPADLDRRHVGPVRQFESILFCSLFADDRETANAVAHLAADEQTFPAWDHFDVFARHIAAVLRGENQRVSWNAYEQTRYYKHVMINPYRQPLVDFSAGERQAINAATDAFEEAYARRGRARDSTHLAHGASSLGQAMSFDVYGVALLKLAAWGGVEPQVDTRALPLAFSAAR